VTILLVGAELFHSDRQTDGQADRRGLGISRFSQFCNLGGGEFILTVVYLSLIKCQPYCIEYSISNGLATLNGV